MIIASKRFKNGFFDPEIVSTDVASIEIVV